MYASHDGIITFAGEDGSAGWGVVIRTNETYDYKGESVYFKTIYWHLLPKIPVKSGQQVRIGEVIGYGDSTGYSTGPHLHFGLKPMKQGEEEWQWFNTEQNNGYGGAIDPEPYLIQKPAYTIKQSLVHLREILSRMSLLLSLYLSKK